LVSIDQVLNAKGREVATISCEKMLADAATMLDEKRIGAEGGETCGVLSERDIVRQVARIGAQALQMKVSEAMTRSVITIAPTSS